MLEANTGLRPIQPLLLRTTLSPLLPFPLSETKLSHPFVMLVSCSPNNSPSSIESALPGDWTTVRVPSGVAVSVRLVKLCGRRSARTRYRLRNQDSSGVRPEAHALGVQPRTTILAALFLVALLTDCARAPAPAPTPAEGSEQSLAAGTAGALPNGVDTMVERVIDGDTLVVTGGRIIRLIGVDTPETKDPRRPVECFGEQAAGYLTAQLKAGASVRLVGDVDQRDIYGRTLAYVYRLPDGLFVNAELLRAGFAQVLTIPPNVAHADTFVTLAREARLARRGLWGACDQPESP